MAPATTTTTMAPPTALRRRLGFSLFARSSSPEDHAADTHTRDSSGSPVTARYYESDGTEEEDEAEEGVEDEEGREDVEKTVSPLATEDEDDDGVKTPRAQDQVSRSSSVDSFGSIPSSSKLRASLDVPSSTLSDDERTERQSDVDGAEELEDDLEAAALQKCAWYSFDLPVVLALASPVGNWLTGGDHIKNVLLLLFLLFYLHQVIELPWSLYQSARPRRPSRKHVSPSLTTPASAQASSDLRLLELFFLTFSLASPFLGAHLLKLGTSAALGPDTISWFSTALFVLATGIRPWSHLISRLQSHTASLHDTIHYPPTSHPGRANAKMRAELERVKKRVDDIAGAVEGVSGAVKTAARSEEVYDHVDDALDAVEAALRAHERRGAAQRATADARMDMLEAALDALKAQHQQERVVYVHAPAPPPTLAAWAAQWLPAWLGPPQKKAAPKYYGPQQGGNAGRSPRSPTGTMKLRLETIPEDAVVDAREPPAYGETHAMPSWPRSPYPVGKRDPYKRWGEGWWLGLPGARLVVRVVETMLVPARIVARVVGALRV